MASNLSINFNANTANLRAELAVGEASLRKLTTEANRTARSLATSFDAVKAADLPRIFEEIASQQQKNAGISRQLASSTDTLTNSFRQSHGAAAQLSFQFNDLFTQIASGTSVQQALIQQGGQIFQILQTNAGAADLLSKAIGFLSTPLGLAATAGTVFVGVLGKMAYEAAQAESALTKLHNIAVLQGRPASTVTANAEAMTRDMMGRGGITRSDARTGAIAIQQLPNISGAARQTLMESFEALGADAFGGDFQKAAEEIAKAFSSTGQMKSFVEENSLLTGELKEQFNAAVDRKDAFAASELAAQGLRDRLAGVINALKETRAEFGRLATTSFPDIWNPTAPDSAAFEAALRRRLRTPFGQGIRFPEGSAAPTPDQRRADDIVEQFTETQRKLDAATRNRTFLEGRLANGGLSAEEVDRTKSAVKGLTQEIERLQKALNPEDKGIMQRLELELAQQQAKILEGAVGRGGVSGSFQSSLQSMIAAAKESGLDIGITSGTRTRERQQQLWEAALQKYGSEAAARKWVAPPGSSMHEKGLAADLRFGPGAREWAHANAARFGLTFPLGNEPWHIEPRGGRAGGATSGGDADAARMDAQRNAVKFWEDIRNSGRVTGDDLISVDRKIADARRQLAEGTLRDNEKSARDAMQETAKQARAREQEALKTIRTSEQDLARQTQLDQSRLQQIRAEGQVAVAFGNATPAQARAVEANAYDQLLAKQREAAVALVDLAQSLGLSADHIERLKDRVEKIDTDRQTNAIQQWSAEMVESAERMKKWTAEVKTFFNEVGDAITRAITGLLTGRRTWAQTLRDLFSSVLSSAVSGAGSLLSKLGAKALGATGGEGLGDFLGSKALGLFNFSGSSSTTSSTASVAGGYIGLGGQTATSVANTTSSALTQTAENTAAVAANTGSTGALATTFSSGFGALAGLGVAVAAIAALPSIIKAGTDFVGPKGLGGSTGGQVLLGSIGASFLLSGMMKGGMMGFARGGIVPSAAGGWALPAFAGAQPALLHSREMVLPERISTGLQAAINNGGIGGGGDTYHISAVDGRSVAQLIMSQPGAVAAAMRRAKRNFQPA